MECLSGNDNKMKLSDRTLYGATVAVIAVVILALGTILFAPT
jgi:hypothetical protein